MQINIKASTKNNYEATKEEFDLLSGSCAGVCYMPETFVELDAQPAEVTLKRANSTLGRGHHSVADHAFVTLELIDIPKALAMVLNNEKMYTTSEKSARYTRMVMTEQEEELYNEWQEIFENLIRAKYQARFPEFFADSRCKKLAQENARYLISVFTPTSMAYTVSYRQLNYLYTMMKSELSRENKDAFALRLAPYIQEFCTELEKLPYINEKLCQNEKHSHLSLLNTKRYRPATVFSDVYSTTYMGSFAQLAQAHRHRTLSYDMFLPDQPEFYFPPILNEYPDLMQKWYEDMASVAGNFPQGMMVEIHERGELDKFILKMKERKCTFAQLEINNQTIDTLTKYVEALRASGHPRAEELAAYTHGSRCTFPDYQCLAPCHFADGVTEERLI